MSDSSLWERFKDWITDDHDPHRELKCPKDPLDPKYDPYAMEISRIYKDIALQLETIAENEDDVATKQHLLEISHHIRALELYHTDEYVQVDPEWWDDK